MADHTPPPPAQQAQAHCVVLMLAQHQGNIRSTSCVAWPPTATAVCDRANPDEQDPPVI